MITDITSIVPLLTSICFFIIFVVLLRTEKNRTNRALTYYILANIVWSFGSFMMHLNSPIFTPLFWNRFMVSALLLIPMLYYDFACKYALKQNKLVIFNTLAYFFLEILNISGLIVSQAEFNGNSFIYEPGRLILVAYGVDYAIMILSAITLLLSYRKEEDLFRKIGLKYVIIGSFILMAGTLANLSPILGAYPIDILSNLINSLLILYAVFRFKFIKTRRFARKLTTYILAIFLTVVITVLITYISIFIIIPFIENTFKLSTTNNNLFHMLLFIAIIVVVTTLIYEQVKKTLEKNLFKKHTSIEKSIKSSIERYLTCDNINSFAELFSSDLKFITGCDCLYLFLYDRLKNLYIDPDIKNSSFQVSTRSMLIEYFKSNNKPIFSSYIDIYPEFTGVTHEEQEFIENKKIGLIIPLFHKEEILCLAFLRVKEESFIEDPEILDYINELTLNISIILKNLMLLENLSQANKEISEIKEKRDLFFAKMLHDIRNYITVITEATKLTFSDGVKDSDKKNLPDLILRQSNELVLLLNNLMELSRIEFKGITLEKRIINIETLLEEVLEANLVRVNDKNIKLNLKIDDDSSSFYADPLRLKEVFDNLIINSINYLKNDGVIEISYYKSENKHYFSVKNNGPKIPENSLEQIFSPFASSNKKQHTIPGFGIGLSIVEEIVKLHGGEIIARNLDQGVEFLFYIPSN